MRPMVKCFVGAVKYGGSDTETHRSPYHSEIPMTLETIEKEALDLPAEERAKLAEKLLLSLDTLSEAETEQLWFREAQRRAAEIDQGLVELVSVEELESRIQAALQ